MNVPVSIRINQKQIDHIKKVARRMSSEFDRDISYADLIRQSINRNFPFPVDQHKNIGLFLKAKG